LVNLFTMGIQSSKEEFTNAPLKMEELNITLLGCGEVGKTTLFRYIHV
jgi:GTPase SAR1 family protein